jgi:hypothetical protein
VQVSLERGRIPAMGRIRSIKRHNLWVERRSAIGDGRGRYDIIQVRYAILMNIPCFECDVPLIIELAIIPAAQPIQIVVAHTPLLIDAMAFQFF